MLVTRELIINHVDKRTAKRESVGVGRFSIPTKFCFGGFDGDEVRDTDSCMYLLQIHTCNLECCDLTVQFAVLL